MTSQCASGSGQFLENIARYLGVAVEEIGPLSKTSQNPEKCSSICAVLAETDVINMVSRGIATPDILKGIHLSNQAGASPLVNEPMYQSANPKAPPMTQAEFDLGRKIYFERCAGCHGVLRKGATGKPLTPDITLGKGTDYLKVFITYGSPAGMPNWGTSGELNEKTGRRDGALRPAGPAEPPEFGMKEMKATWKVIVAAGAAADEEDEQLQHRQHLLDDAARHRRGGADRRRHQEDHQHRQDRLRGAHLAHVGLGPLPVRDRPRRQDQHDRPLDGDARQRRRDPHRPRGALGRHLQVQGLRGDYTDKLRDRRRLLAAAVRDHERRHARAAQDRLHPRHDVDTQEYHPEPRVASIVASHFKPEFVVNVKETGKIAAGQLLEPRRAEDDRDRLGALPARRRLGLDASATSWSRPTRATRSRWSTPRRASWPRSSTSARSRTRVAAPTSSIRSSGRSGPPATSATRRSR